MRKYPFWVTKVKAGIRGHTGSFVET
jgi:hypothetical protein